MPDGEEIQGRLQKVNLLMDSLDEMLEGDDLQQAKAALLNQKTKLEAQLTGAGAIALGTGATAVGAGGMLIGGNLNGDYIASGGIKNFQPDPEAEKRRKSSESYLNRLSRVCLSLPLAALGGDESTEYDITLDKVYIALNTTEVREFLEETLLQEKKVGVQGIVKNPENVKPVTALETASEHSHLALLGDPGAGKSTFVKMLLAWQVNAYLGRTDPPQGFTSNLLPVLIILRDLAPRLGELHIEKLPKSKQDDQLVKAICEHIFADLGADCADFQNGLHEALKNGRCLLALDGLDEVPQDLRRRVRQAVDALLKRYAVQHIIVTCRVRSYVEEAVLPQFKSSTLAAFTREQIGHFVQGWYNTQYKLGGISEKQAKERADDLINAAGQSGLRELTGNPMLLTTMAIIHQRNVGLPRERVRLYQLAVDVLLRRWQKNKVGDAALAEFLKNDLKLRSMMESLAYAAHRAGSTLFRKDVIDLLEKNEQLGSLHVAGEFLDYVDQRAGLLVGDGGELNKPTTYSFPHRTFQEYLAGAYLAGQRQLGRTFIAHAAEGDSWDQAAQLAFEELYYNRRAANELLDMAYQLGAEFKRGEQNERVLLWAGQIITLVGREAVERDSHPCGGKAYVMKLRQGLVQVLGGCLPPIERAEAGRVLAKLGDPRKEVLTCEHMIFCHIPAGSFRYGDKKKVINLRNDFWVGKYPVTNAQFNQFVAAGGYTTAHFWQEAKAKNKWVAGKVKGRFDENFRSGAIDFGEPYSLPNHPVVGVTWYEAQAFARWLSEQATDFFDKWVVENNVYKTEFRRGLICRKLCVLLPTAEQWEKAARGADGRTYPWGENPDPNRANFFQTGINSTNTVGCFPGGKSPYGAMEMTGNVWEWASTANEPKRFLHGGSFNEEIVYARCASRYGLYSDFNLASCGFRVVVSQVFLPPLRSQLF